MATHAPFITLPYKLERAPPPFEPGNDIKYPESLVRYFLKTYTKPGDKIFDPFAGLGTTLFVAEEMKRVPFGVEADSGRHGWVAGQIKHWRNLIHGDTGKLSSYGFPRMDFSMTSPPYMPRNHKWNPLYAGNPAKAGYDVYLRRMKHIYRQLSSVMKRNAIIVVQVDNLHSGKIYTPLVRDLSNALSGIMTLEQEMIVAWDGGRADYRHTHCLIFRNA